MEKIKELILEGNIKEALELASKMESIKNKKQISKLIVRFNQNRSDFLNGLINESSKSIEDNKITQIIIDLISDADSQKELLVINIGKIKLTKRSFVYVSLFLIMAFVIFFLASLTTILKILYFADKTTEFSQKNYNELAEIDTILMFSDSMLCNEISKMKESNIAEIYSRARFIFSSQAYLNKVDSLKYYQKNIRLYADEMYRIINWAINYIPMGKKNRQELKEIANNQSNFYQLLDEHILIVSLIENSLKQFDNIKNQTVIEMIKYCSQNRLQQLRDDIKKLDKIQIDIKKLEKLI